MIKRNIVRFVSLWVLGLVGFIAWRLYFELPLGAAELLGVVADHRHPFQK